MAANTSNPGPPIIFDRQAYRARRSRAAKIPSDGFWAKETAKALATRIAAVNRAFGDALDLGSRRQGLPALASLARRWIWAGFDVGGRDDALEVVASEEAIPFAPESFDLVTSALALHAVNDLPGALIQIRQILRPDGLFLAALFGGETLFELRQVLAEAESETLGGISPRVAPFADVRDLGGLLQRAGFALPVTDIERTVVRYADPLRLFNDLRMLGETNILAQRMKAPMARQILKTALQRYSERYSDEDGRVRATFDVVYLTGWAPHESQQKPLKPGSAARRLADALGTKEFPTGEKPR